MTRFTFDRMDTVWQLLQRGDDQGVAIGSAEGGAPLRHGQLRALIERTVAALNAAGVGRGSRVATALRNSPETAAALLAISCGATAAPLNPALTAEEFDFELGDLRADVVVAEAGAPSPMREVAAARGLPIVELVAETAGGAGSFRLVFPQKMAGPAPHGGFAGRDDIALLLHTSGSTARPKLVPLLQRNLAASARHIVAALLLTPHDVCLNVMPLFHIHGLVAGLLSSLAAGGAAVCTPGFNGLRFFRWFAEARPTWYTAVPTMHQAILSRAHLHRVDIARGHLRFIRSCSSSLPPVVMEELERTFHCPVVEAYGMTEAAHQMTCNPLPPAARKPGSVGVPSGCEVAIMGEAGELLPQGSIGEVVIRGPNVTPGYEANDEANAKSFAGGWFRTGDQGMLDAGGYLHLTGRLKELINRGGEKIAPLEIDQVLMRHPAVQQCVSFGMPHEHLGEEIAAAIVLREGKTSTERELREFAARHLSHSKLPRKVVFVHEIPKGATGKLQRIGLAHKLGLVS